MKANNTMNPKPLDAGLAERLGEIFMKAYKTGTYQPWEAVAAAVRKIVKEAKESK